MVARRGTNGHVKWHTNCLTSYLCSPDNAEADGSIPSWPTKRPGQWLFLEPVSASTLMLRSPFDPTLVPLIKLLLRRCKSFW